MIKFGQVDVEVTLNSNQVWTGKRGGYPGIANKFGQVDANVHLKQSIIDR